MTRDEMREVVESITYKPGYQLYFSELSPRPYFQVIENSCLDTFTMRRRTGKGGKVFLSEFMTVSEIVRKAFQAFAAYEEHECREWFRYRGATVFGPHIDVDALIEVSKMLDVRRDV